jgi:hypothetical protein
VSPRVSATELLATLADEHSLGAWQRLFPRLRHLHAERSPTGGAGATSSLEEEEVDEHVPTPIAVPGSNSANATSTATSAAPTTSSSCAIANSAGSVSRPRQVRNLIRKEGVPSVFRKHVWLLVSGTLKVGFRSWCAVLCCCCVLLLRKKSHWFSCVCVACRVRCLLLVSLACCVFTVFLG